MTSPKLLKGHSGARLSIEVQGGVHYVRKQAGDSSRNARLKQQAEKQQDAARRGVACPRILATGEKDDCYYFDMEYVPSVSVAQTLIESRPFDRDGLIAFVDATLSEYAGQVSGHILASTFLDKISSIENACKANTVLADILPSIQEVITELKRLDWNDIPESPCHGDLTLENILIGKDQGFILVDFDAVEINSFYLDFAKLCQDLAGHWCLRELALSEPGNIKLLNAMVHLDSLGAKMLQKFGKQWPGLAGKVLQMTVFHLIRVLPYCKKVDIAVYVIMRARQLLFRRDASLFGYLG